MKKIKVLGIGSPFGEDDIGWKVVEQLKKKETIQSKMSQLVIENCDRPGIRLLEYMQSFDTVFLIDAVVTGHSIGTVFRMQNETIEELKLILSSHEIGIAQALQLGRALNQLPKDVIFYGIEITALQTAERSPLIVSAMERLVRAIEKELISLLDVDIFAEQQ